MSGAKGMYQLLSSLYPARQQLRNHELYQAIKTVEDVQLFMEYHVFAVWDFMCLLKCLQRALTCIELPWLPTGKPVMRRLINEIVLAEETDEIPSIGCYSHFELYLEAMRQVGAETGQIEDVLARLRGGVPVSSALAAARVPLAARLFVENTWNLVETGSLHAIAAAFTFGREEPIPGMFRSLVSRLQKQFPGHMDLLVVYLDRHIHLDEGHASMAVDLLAELCGEDINRWEEAREAVISALSARLALWSGIVSEISLSRIGVVRLKQA